MPRPGYGGHSPPPTQRTTALVVESERDHFVAENVQFYQELAGINVLVQIAGGDHWGYGDTITWVYSPAVLPNATLPEQQVAQRLLATHFITLFFRKYVIDEPGISTDLELEEVLDRVPGTEVNVTTSV